MKRCAGPGRRPRLLGRRRAAASTSRRGYGCGCTSKDSASGCCALYRERCALCHLKHRELLDAAHIVPDAHPEGEPVVTNGLALCKIHHAAFDHYLIGVRPDYVVEVHPRILAETDGPMLRHGLQGMHETRIELPGSRKDHPDPERLRDRYERFKGAA